MCETFVCSVCKRTFNLKSSYSNHIKFCKERSNEIRICEHCGKEHDGTFGSGRFCSKACANARSHEANSRVKCSETLKAALLRIEQEGRHCEKCGTVYHSKDLSRKLCFGCLPATIRYSCTKREEPQSILDLSKRTVIKILRRMKLPCSCCGFYIEGVSLDIHHILPRQLGGSDDMSNLTYICPNCHRIAHTNSFLLSRPLISIVQQLESLGLDWKEFYYVK